jgi:NADH-quinone oxidoreductase subunit G
VVSLLLANHPLDCPVCDKGGECPLQDNTFKYGPGVSAFTEEKRHKDKAFELSERIVLDKERCILCYRCVRFHQEIPGDSALAIIDRGGHGEIGVLDGDKYDSPFQGNTIDICPVGALTSRQYRFRARPWDLKHTPGICAGCSTGCNTDIHSRDGRVLRQVPRENLDVNDVWLCDRGRFDTLPRERAVRLQTPMIREGGVLREATWFEALRKASLMMRHGKTGIVASPTLSNEALAIVGGALRFHVDSGAESNVAVWPRAGAPWPVKGSIASIAKSKSIVAIGIDVWTQLSMLALWFHKATVAGANLVVINAENGLFRDTKHWVKAEKGTELAVVERLIAALQGGAADDDTKAIVASLAERPTTFLVGTALASDPEAKARLEVLAQLLGADGTGGLVGAPTPFANGAGAMALLPDLAFQDASTGGGVLDRAWKNELETLVLLGDTHVTNAGSARGVLFTAKAPLEGPTESFVDVVLPLAHAYEQAGSFTNLEGRVQGFDQGGIPPNGAKADWHALALLVAELGTSMPTDLKSLRARLASSHPFFSQVRTKGRVELRVA